MEGIMNRLLIAVLTGIMFIPVSATAQDEPEENRGPRGKMLEFRESLTGEQTGRIRNIKQELEKKTVRLRADMQVANIELRQLLEDESASESQIRDQLETIASIEVDLKMGRIVVRNNVKSILTQEQLENLPKFGLRPRYGIMGRQGGNGMHPGRRMLRNAPPGQQRSFRGNHGNFPGANRSFDVRNRRNGGDFSIEGFEDFDEDIAWIGRAVFGEMDQDLFVVLIEEELEVMLELPEQYDEYKEELEIYIEGPEENVRIRKQQ